MYGCKGCSKSYNPELPRDVLQLMVGDSEYPIEDRAQICADYLIEALFTNQSERNFLYVGSEYNTPLVFTKLIKRLGKGEVKENFKVDRDEITKRFIKFSEG